jgi:hypothetical protein
MDRPLVQSHWLLEAEPLEPQRNFIVGDLATDFRLSDRRSIVPLFTKSPPLPLSSIVDASTSGKLNQRARSFLILLTRANSDAEGSGDLEQRISVVLEIDKLGHVTSASTDAQPRTVGNKTAATPWRGLFSDWRMLNGFEVPAKGEVEWILKDGRFPYWHGELLAVEAIDSNAHVIPR